MTATRRFGQFAPQCSHLPSSAIPMILKPFIVIPFALVSLLVMP
jgi:hypothetical protein